MPRTRPGPVRLVLLVAFALVVVSVAWLVGSCSSPPSPPAPSSDVITSVGDDKPNDEVALVAPSANEVETARTEVSTSEAGLDLAYVLPVAAVPDHLAHVRVLVRAKEDGSPQAGVRVGAWGDNQRSMLVVQSSRAAVGAMACTGSDGRAELDLEPGRAVRIEADDDWFRHSEQKIDWLSAGETIDVVFELPTAADVRLCGQLVAAESGQPVAGTIKVVKGRRYGETVAAASDGIFEITAFSWERALASADADGRATTTFALDHGYEDPARPLLVRLPVVATAEFWVRDPAGSPIRSAPVTIRASCYHVQQSSLEMLDSRMGDDHIWNVETDAEGRATIAQLIPRVPLRVSVSRAGFVGREIPEPLCLEPGEFRRVELLLDGGTTIVGRLETSDGNPVSRREVWLMPATTRSRELFESYEQPTSTARTDRDGQFQFERVASGEWLIGPAPVEKPDILAVAERFVVAGDVAEQPVVLRADSGLYIHGQVVDAMGAPAVSSSVHATKNDRAVYGHARSDDAGSFAIGPIPVGTYVVGAEPGDHLGAPSLPVEAEAGASGLVLQLRVGGTIAGSVVKASTAELVECELTCGFEAIALGAETSWTMRVCADGMFSFSELALGTYVVVARARGGWIGLRRGIVLEPGARIDIGRVELRTGATLRLVTEGEPKPINYRIVLDGATIDFGSLAQGGTSSICVPGSTLEVRWNLLGSRDERVEKITVEADEYREVVLN